MLWFGLSVHGAHACLRLYCIVSVQYLLLGMNEAALMTFGKLQYICVYKPSLYTCAAQHNIEFNLMILFNFIKSKEDAAL